MDLFSELRAADAKLREVLFATRGDTFRRPASEVPPASSKLTTISTPSFVKSIHELHGGPSIAQIVADCLAEIQLEVHKNSSVGTLWHFEVHDCRLDYRIMISEFEFRIYVTGQYVADPVEDLPKPARCDQSSILFAKIALLIDGSHHVMAQQSEPTGQKVEHVIDIVGQPSTVMNELRSELYKLATPLTWYVIIEHCNFTDRYTLRAHGYPATHDERLQSARRASQLVERSTPWSEVPLLGYWQTDSQTLRKVSADTGRNSAGEAFVIEQTALGSLVDFAGRERLIPDQFGGRAITTHRVNGLNESIGITALDTLGQGGACHVYEVLIAGEKWIIKFQNGPIKEAGVNGISNEALLAILIDRMEGFQGGHGACHDNQMALDHMQSARLWLYKRTMDRVARNVEGTHIK